VRDREQSRFCEVGPRGLQQQGGLVNRVLVTGNDSPIDCHVVRELVGQNARIDRAPGAAPARLPLKLPLVKGDFIKQGSAMADRSATMKREALRLVS
jgi:hypothetical protein